MDYKEKYEMVLETIQEILDSGSDSIKMSRLKLRLQSVFPELKESKDERTRKELADFIERLSINPHSPKPPKSTLIEWLAWLKKLEEQQSLYIRFGEIPDNEKSKIYRGEEEIGEEDGVSVYPAFEVNGDIVLGLTLPITKTTLYTQQHLLEYENRPCYLVKGDYVGKDADGQPLICNVQIIKKIDNYRVKEEKVDNTNDNKHELVDNVKPKFQPGDWIVVEDACKAYQVERCVENTKNHKYGYDLTNGSYIDSEYDRYHLWTLNDAKDGDILVSTVTNKPFIYNGNFDDIHVGAYCGINCLNEYLTAYPPYFWAEKKNIAPATKKQCELLSQKMEEGGYTFDFDKKELNKITKFKVGDWVVEPREDDPNILWHIDRIIDGFYWNGSNGVSIEIADKYYHVWSFDDANDGDILVSLITNKPFIYNGKFNENHVGAYCGVGYDDEFVIAHTQYYWTEKKDIVPATKEQRNTLFAKIEEMGYKWDAENKKLINKYSTMYSKIKDKINNLQTSVQELNGLTDDDKSFLNAVSDLLEKIENK